MRLIKIMERKGDEYDEYKKAVKMAKHAIKVIADLTEDMEEKYSERDDWDYDDDEHDKKYRRSSR